MSTHTGHTDTEVEPFDVDDPRLTRFDLVREGARRDGVEIVHYQPRFPVPGTKREVRTVRVVSLLFLLCGLFGTAFVVAYIWWPWQWNPGDRTTNLYTPILGLTLGLCLACLALGLISWGKKLLPEEIAVQDRHDGPSPDDERKMTGATILNMGDELGIRRRPLLAKAALFGMLPVGLAVAAPLVGGLIKDPHHPDIFEHTGWDPDTDLNPGGKGAPLPVVLADGTKIRPQDVSVGGQITVFPGLIDPDTHEFVGASNDFADSPTLLIHLREQDAAVLKQNLSHVRENVGHTWGNYVAYSKICTHAGCPASLYEQQTNRLLCPCHQSQFNILDNARPIFGPATRHLPMLPLTVVGGYFVAGIQQADGTVVGSDYREPVGPGFWERS